MPLRTALKELLQSLEIYDHSLISNKASEMIDKRYFVVTMDDGTYFREFDYNFDIARQAFDLKNIKRGPYYRVPRDAGRHVIAQAQDLKEKYVSHGSRKPIVLCDDGIGTGRSLENILNVFDQLEIEVVKCFVLLNPNKVASIFNVDIETIFEHDDNFSWLSERDLFWGLPRSGVTCRLVNDEETVFMGIPYTIDLEMIESRIANFGPDANEFRRICLTANVKLWSFIEKNLGRDFRIRDISRLKALGAVLGIENERLASFIQEVAREDYRFE